MAQECIHEWTTQSTDHTSVQVVFKASFVEEKHREGVSRGLFDHIWSALSKMNCWEDGEVNKPWKSTVVYDVPPNMLEHNVEDLRKECHVMRTLLQCDDHGNDTEQIVSYLKEPPLSLGIAKHASIDLSIERRCGARNYIKKEANFLRISMDVSKRLVFKEHYDWHYDFILRYREPYFKTHDLMEDVADKDIIFRDPPVCLFEISCAGVKNTHDDAYFTDSFLCKVMDILPPEWRSIPLHVKVPLRRPNP